eukprot:2596625-Amphidinium_carterae.2
MGIMLSFASARGTGRADAIICATFWRKSVMRVICAQNVRRWVCCRTWAMRATGKSSNKDGRRTSICHGDTRTKRLPMTLR